ncbi:MAG: cutinase family protein [Gammaproteobacteria bacterium]|nr:MAG: cutinase family protein [Gammaproteobacteria bacterium]
MTSLLKNKFFILILIICLGIINLIFMLLRSPNAENAEHITVSALNLDKKENIQIAHAANPEKGLLLLIVDKDKATVNEDYAKKFASLSYYVAIFDVKSLLNSPANETTRCLDLAEKLTTLGTQLQAHLKLDTTDLPILVGVESGASVVYAALAQAEKQKFHAAVGINFSSQLQSHSPLCSQENFTNPAQGNTPSFTPVKRLPTSFYVFQDEKSPSIASKEFADKIGNLKLTREEDSEHALSEAIQILQWLDPRLADQISSDASDSDLPVIEVPSTDVTSITQSTDKTTDETSANEYNSETLAVLITGDGGWAAIDKNIARILAEKGIATVGFDALSYFWKARTPEETTTDVESVITQYLEKWNKKRVILIGYSFGADVLPFITNNLTDDSKKRLALVALLGMGKTAAFEFRLSSWMNADKDSSRLPLLPEIEKMKWANSICIYGVDDPAANCVPIAGLGVRPISMTGDHHFDEKYEELVQHIIENIKQNP